MLRGRALRAAGRFCCFHPSPFPPVELFAQLPWRRGLLEGLLGADFLGFQRVADAQNFVRACRQLLRATTKKDTVTFPGPGGVPAERTARRARAAGFPPAYSAADLPSSPVIRSGVCTAAPSLGVLGRMLLTSRCCSEPASA